MHPIAQRFKRRPYRYGALVLITVQFILAAPDISARMEQQQSRKTARLAERNEQARLLLEEKNRNERSEIAQRRYESGCLRIGNAANGQPIVIKTNDTIFDPANLTVPVGGGLVVCDGFGNTGITDPQGRVQDIATLLDLSKISNPTTTGAITK